MRRYLPLLLVLFIASIALAQTSTYNVQGSCVTPSVSCPNLTAYNTTTSFYVWFHAGQATIDGIVYPKGWASPNNGSTICTTFLGTSGLTPDPSDLNPVALDLKYKCGDGSTIAIIAKGYRVQQTRYTKTTIFSSGTYTKTQ